MKSIHRLRVTQLGAAALLALGLSTAAQAQSQVTVYGIAAVEAVHVTGVADNLGVGTRNKLENSKVSSSRLGFKGFEDLGGGTGAIFGLESGINIDTGGTQGGFWNRGSYVGLTNKSFGTLTFGRQWNVNDDIMASYFVFDGYAAFFFTEFDYLSDLVNNSIKYVSPTFGGLTVRGLVAAGEGVTGRTTEVAADYKIGGLSVGASYRAAKGLNGETDKLASGGVSYTIGDFRPHVGVSQSEMAATFGTSYPKARAYDVGVQWAPSSLVTLDLDYVARDQRGTDNDSHFFRVQAQYFLSKRTTLLANVVGLKNKGTASEHFFGSGAAGKSQSVLALGLRHAF